MSPQRHNSEAPIRYIDVSRTCLQKRFFSNFEFASSDELLAAVAGMQIDLDTIAQSKDLRSYVYSGWVYWLLYLKGYLQYTESEIVSNSNIYFNYLTKYYSLRAHDPGLQQVMADPQRVVERVTWRFRDTEFFRKHAAEDPSRFDNVAPVRIIVSELPSENRLLLYHTGSDSPLKAKLVDGWHRLFSAKLFGIHELRCEVIQDHV